MQPASTARQKASQAFGVTAGPVARLQKRPGGVSGLKSITLSLSSPARRLPFASSDWLGLPLAPSAKAEFGIRIDFTARISAVAAAAGFPSLPRRRSSISRLPDLEQLPRQTHHAKEHVQRDFRPSAQTQHPTRIPHLWGVFRLVNLLVGSELFSQISVRTLQGLAQMSL